MFPQGYLDENSFFLFVYGFIKKINEKYLCFQSKLFNDQAEKLQKYVVSPHSDSLAA